MCIRDRGGGGGGGGGAAGGGGVFGGLGGAGLGGKFTFINQHMFLRSFTKFC